MPKSVVSAQRLHILVADDIPSSRTQMTDMLKSLGHQVIAVESGEAALQAVAKSSPDLVLLDLLMPGLSGFEVARQIRDTVTDHWVPVIVMSSLEGEEHLIYAHSNGADDYLVRPVSPGMLEAKLRHYARMLGMQNRLLGLARRQKVINDNIMDAVLTFDETGVVREFNQAAYRLLAGPNRPLSGQAVEAVLGESLVDLMHNNLTTLMRGNGQDFPAELVWSSWREQGRMQYTLVIHDLTERKRIDRMKDEFLATVSHELRTPLTSVLGALGLIASGMAGSLPKPVVEMASIAKRNGERLGKLIDDVLDLTKLEGGQMVLHVKPCNPYSLLMDAVDGIKAATDVENVHLHVSGTDRCPPVTIDPDRFLQVMANLLSNALKHSQAGDTIWVRLFFEGQVVKISVRDEGPGVDPAFRKRMFEKFSQADASDQRSQGGSGLGLYVSRLFVERMGGRIFCDSRPGAGATFSIEFPAASQAQSKPSASTVDTSRR